MRSTVHESRGRADFLALVDEFVDHLDAETGVITAPRWTVIEERTGIPNTTVSRFVQWGRRATLIRRVQANPGGSVHYVVLGQLA